MIPESNLNGKKVLIIGGLGFIGSNIAQRMAEEGAEITILDACLDPYGWNFFNVNGFNHKFIKGDIRDQELLSELVKDKDIIIDCAAQVSHTLSMSNPLLDADINCKGPLTLLEACRKNNPHAKIIYASSRGVIGGIKEGLADEESPTNPVDINGIDKLSAEKYYLLYNRLYDIKCCILRINNGYGPKSQVKTGDYAIINWFIKKAILNQEITLFGGGEQVRDYSYVDDIAEAFVLAAKREESNGEIFLIGSGQRIKLKDICELIVKCVGKGKIFYVPWDNDRKNIEIGSYVVNNKKIKEKLGWQPKIDLIEGIQKTVDFYNTYKEHYF